MKLSTKGRYGLRAMIDLAVYSVEGPVKLISIAERQGISLSYLETVFSLLKNSGLVISVKGPNGGYKLAEVPESITVGQVLWVLEGPLDLADEAAASEAGAPSRLKQCLKRCVWDQMNDGVKKMTDARTLASLVSNYKVSAMETQDQFFI